MAAGARITLKGKASALTTTDLSARELAVRTDAGEESLEFENNGATAVLRLHPERSKSVSIETPADGDRIALFMNPRAVTVTGVSFASVAGTSVLFNVEYAATLASGTVIHTDTCATSTPEWDVTPSGTATVPTNQIVMLEITTVTASVTQLHVTVHYTIDA
jgi:hypothetical protein